MSTPQPHPGAPARTREQVADLHFMDARYKLLDLAAFLDRLDRAAGGEDHNHIDGAIGEILRLSRLGQAQEKRGQGRQNALHDVASHWADVAGYVPLAALGAYGSFPLPPPSSATPCIGGVAVSGSGNQNRRAPCCRRARK